MKSQQLVGTVVQATKAERRECACTDSCMIAKTNNSHDKKFEWWKVFYLLIKKKHIVKDTLLAKHVDSMEMLQTCLIPTHNNYFVVRNQNTKISFKFWVGHHEMVSND